MADRPEHTTPHVPEVAAGWSTEEAWWRDNLRSRPYAKPDREFEHYRGALRYGWERAQQHESQLGWSDVESDMRYGWEDSPYRGKDFSAWDEVKDAVRDAWQRVRGEARVPHSKR
jgi:hypothetical protein